MKTHQKLYLTIFLIIGSHFANAQNTSEFAKAILVDNSEVKDQVFKKINADNLNKLYSVNSANLLFYDWNSEKHTINFSATNKFPEKPSETVIFLMPKGSFDLNPPFQLDTDTTGKVTAAYFVLTKEVKYLCKHIDAVTSTVLSHDVFYLMKKSQMQLKLQDINKEFGGDPGVLIKSNRKKYDELLANLRKSYAQKIIDAYVKDYNEQTKFSRFGNMVLGGSQRAFEIIKPTGKIESKTKSITFKGGVNDNLVVRDYYKVLVKKDIEGYHYYDDVVTMAIKEIGEEESIATTELLSSKALSEALSSNDQLLLVRMSNVQVLNKINTKNDVPLINIAIKKNCLFCDEALESAIYECPVFTLIERNAPELKYFAALTKDERFIDYSVEDLQGKQIGYQILLVSDNKNFEAIETKTNRILGSFKKTYQVMADETKTELNISQSSIQRFLSSYNPAVYKVDWVKTLEEKKDKINEILVYHPAGMDRYMEYDFFTLVTETVEGEKIDRKNKIGSGKIGKSYSPNISVLKIKDGEKEIYKAKSMNEKIIIEVSDKSIR